jgi:glycosyltransferase involved in cell wall biosynthesis
MGSTVDDLGDRVAVVVCTRDRPAQLASALEAIRDAVRPEDEVVVVDSASRNAAVAQVARRAGVHLVRADVPGLSRARNVGLRRTEAPIIAFTDDDCRPRAGWTAAIARPFVDPMVGFVAGRVVAGDAGGAIVTVADHDERRRIDAATDPIDIGHGANMAFRRIAIEAVDGFDELLGAGGRFRAAEDHDAFWRLLHRGWYGVYEPDAVVEHAQWRTRAGVVRLEYGYGLGAGAFAAKTARVHGREGCKLLAHRLWGNGVAQAWRDARVGYVTGAASSAMKTAGVVTGALTSIALPIDEGRFRA